VIGQYGASPVLNALRVWIRISLYGRNVLSIILISG